MEFPEHFSFFLFARGCLDFCVRSLHNERILPAAEVTRAIGLLQAGQTQRQVAGQLNISQSVVSRLWNRFQQTGNVSERSRFGRPRCTTARQDRYLGNLARRQRFQSALRLNSDFRQATGRQISTQTVRNRLHLANLCAYRPAVKPVLTRMHRIARRQWSAEHVTWQLLHWRPVLFTDESRFCADFHDGRRRVWRTVGERYADCCRAQHDRFGGGSVIVWAGSIEGRTDLHGGALTVIRYRDEILHPIVRPFAGAVGDDFILMDDNARPHMALVVNDYLEAETIAHMEWPNPSPDLKPMLWTSCSAGYLPVKDSQKTVMNL